MVRAHDHANHHTTTRHTDHRTTAPMRGNHRQQLLAFALAYADAGWPIFPLRPGTKRPAEPNHLADRCDGTDPRCTTAAGHLGWEQRATTDHGRIRRTWGSRVFGIGIACGPAGLVVIDLDVPKHTGITGADSLRQLEHQHGQQLPATFTVATPSGGRHLYYQRPPGARIRNSAGTVAPGIDIRAAGGYVAAPPTRIAAGGYEVIDDAWPPVLPHWFSQILDPPTNPTPTGRTGPRPTRPGGTGSDLDRRDRYVQAAVAGELAKLRDTGPGNRNHHLFLASVALGQLVAAGALDRADVEQLLFNATVPWHGIRSRPNDPKSRPFTAGEARYTIASGLRRGLNEPRTLPARPVSVGSVA